MSNKKDKDGNLLPDDQRLNKYGRILRSTRLDELPELINILKGDMSLVGPRPERPEIAKLYEKQLQIVDLPLNECPAPNESPKPIGGHVDGCRIGFDAGGSDRKVSAVIDGPSAKV